MPAPIAVPSGNHLLDRLSPEDFERLRPGLEPVLLTLDEILAKPRDPIEYVYFPQRGIVSLVAALADHDPIEVGLIGNEGLAGTPVLLGASTSPVEMMVQVAGAALRIKPPALREAMSSDAALSTRLLRFAQALYSQVSQTAACNARHRLDERLARWLLMAHDRVADGELPLTHEFLAMMLCVRRSGVTEAMRMLRRRGLISNRQGHITIIDREGLEQASCACYGIVRREYEHLLA
jgi:CRP-like cAMP-binding protein